MSTLGSRLVQCPACHCMVKIVRKGSYRKCGKCGWIFSDASAR
jgi:hypothetical protein